MEDQFLQGLQIFSSGYYYKYLVFNGWIGLEAESLGPWFFFVVLTLLKFWLLDYIPIEWLSSSVVFFSGRVATF